MKRALRWLAPHAVVPAKLRVRLYRWSGLRVGQGSGIEPHATIHGDGLVIGSGCYVNERCLFDAKTLLILGKGVFVGFGAQFITSSHEIADRRQRAGNNTLAPIVVGDGVWVGAGAIILPGVTLGDGCVIAAGSVVNADTKPDALYAGVPAVLKKALL